MTSKDPTWESTFQSNHLGEFQETFLQKVFLEDVRNYKGIKFLKLKILDKDNKTRVMHYKDVDPIKDEKFSDQIAISHV
ncbi:hypothetical protein CR513_32321, partial [Mucuna pruriens]